jgi:hypothetical protein
MCGCNKRKSAFSAGQQNAPQQLGSRGMARKEAPTQQTTVKVTYNGPVGSHLVASPTRKRPTYGMHTRGDVFEIHPADQEAAPKLFVLVEEVQAEPTQEKNMQQPPAQMKEAERINKADAELKNSGDVRPTNDDAEGETKSAAKKTAAKESK